MDTVMATQVEELPDNKVRLTVEVPQADLRHAVEHATHDLAEAVKVPGFRKGKVPPQVLQARIGRERIFTEAVESHIGGWFMSAAATSRIRPVAAPQYNYELPTSEDADFSFTATVPVQPKPEPADWSELEVPYAEPEVPPELLDQELEALRESVAELAPVEDRPARTGDVVVLDALDENGEGQRDLVVELGTGRLVEEIERALTGASAGETRDVEFESVDGTTAKATVAVKEIKEEAETQYRAAAVDALVEASKVQVGGPLVESRTRELLNGLGRSLESRGISAETYFQLSGQTAEELVQRMSAEAALSVARELVLEAVADKLGLQVDDAEIEELVREQATLAEDDPDEAVKQVFDSGRQEALREDLRLRKALDRVATEAKRVPAEVARAREEIWTPEKESQPTETKLWTPGSKEPV